MRKSVLMKMNFFKPNKSVLEFCYVSYQTYISKTNFKMSRSKKVSQLSAECGFANPSDYCCARVECCNQATEIVDLNRVYYPLCDTHHLVYKSLENTRSVNESLINSHVDNPKPNEIPTNFHYCWACPLNSKIRPKATTELDYGFKLPSCGSCKLTDEAMYWSTKPDDNTIIPYVETIVDAYEKYMMEFSK